MNEKKDFFEDLSWIRGENPLAAVFDAFIKPIEKSIRNNLVKEEGNKTTFKKDGFTLKKEENGENSLGFKDNDVTLTYKSKDKTITKNEWEKMEYKDQYEYLTRICNKRLNELEEYVREETKDNDDTKSKFDSII
ncbi:MAG: hypothetical protein K6E76_02080 [Patescibacteria group bacterium]|nr:hypothetical protein [Patescibacteria group bacterium]